MAMAVALIAVCSWISIPTTVPFTMQTFAVCLVSALLGTRRGFLAVVCYLLLGAAGAPVFAGFKGGLGALLGVTGGYLVGFLFTALIAGAVNFTAWCSSYFGARPDRISTASATVGSSTWTDWTMCLRRWSVSCA